MRGFPGLDRLTAKFVLGVTLLVILPAIAGFYTLHRHELARTLEIHRRSADLQARLLETTLQHEMMSKDRPLLTSLLKEIEALPEVRSVMVLDREGRITLASPERLVSLDLEPSSPTCQVCHSLDPAAREGSVVLEAERGRILRTVRPIENRPECHQCHAPEQRLNGVLVLDVSLVEVDDRIRRDGGTLLAWTTALAMLLLISAGLVFRRVVLLRLGSLGRMARSISTGDLEARARVGSDDVIGRLERDFNHMASEIARLLQEVRARESQMASVLDSIDDGLVVMDRSLRVVASNAAFRRRCGVHAASLQGCRCRDVTEVLACHQAGRDCAASKCLGTGEVQRVVFPIVNGSEDERVVEEVYASPVFDDEGEVAQVVEIWRDITERVREEERLSEVEHLSSLGVLASGFSHEVNTPLASMLTCAEAILSQIDEASPKAAAEPFLLRVRESADVVRTEALRCRQITDQFLRFSRGVPPSIEPIDLHEVVGAIVGLAIPTARTDQVEVRFDGDASVGPVVANTEVVQHVVLNLLTNAIQAFDGESGSITVTLESGANVRLTIRDTGRGIEPDFRVHLFEPFRSQKARGTGLGLFLSRTFMRRFGGDVRLVESEVGAGSCFEVVFRRLEDRTP